MRKLSPLMQLGLLAGPLLTMVDSSIVNVAVPDIAAELHADLATAQWVVSGYLLALAAGLTTTSYLARRFGTMRVYAVALAAFLLASAGCAAAPGIGGLIAARAVQGFAGAPLVPLAMSVLLGRQGRERRVPVAAGLLFFLAPAIGPSLGGLLIAAGGWRWIFLVNLPIGALALLGVRRLPPEVAPTADGHARPDPVGLLLLSVGLVGVLFGASRATGEGWTDPGTMVTLGVGVALLLAYVWWAPRTRDPAVDLTLLRHGRSALALVLSVTSSVVAFAAVFLLPVFTQSVQRHSAFATGLALLPQGVITGVGTALGQRLAARHGVRYLVVTGFAVLAVASSGLLLLTAATPLWATSLILAGRAAAIGFGITPLLSVMLAPLPDAKLADGNTLFNIAQRLGGSIGVGILGSLLAARAVQVGPVPAFHEIGLVLSGLAVAAALLALRLPTRTPEVALDTIGARSAAGAGHNVAGE
ncbi:DHA2 family efflux MFS transporter permease subunit [Actinoplanes sp. KI2]|uniref:DHA2 family efflux MFS transporter permease subunit n=1 Tax=Actinoplanes sp. KI2 TaxID=2983315 RepID=UPI0021D58517|nr:DHA2 family efflux MFS transporter permease subunit [Actinoplanes sp. KI2]MCU7723392.1 DHA2 family efflux MFS transporter permease subunit [Actinoplanes sp. KI2]